MNLLGKAIIAGFAIFSMLFGSGNLIFPLTLGREFPANWDMALVGWICAAVVIPLLGYFGAVLFDADHRKYLAPLGKYATAILMFIMMMVAGPFGAVARNVNVSFGGMHVVMPELTNFGFNIVYCILMTLSAWNPGKLIQIIGTIFTPLKFGGVAIVLIGVIFFCDANVVEDTVTGAIEAMSGGFKAGYQTMDLLAGFIMSSTVFLYIKNALPESDRSNRNMIIKFCGYACLVGGITLAIAYSGLVYASARCSAVLVGVPAEELFTKAAEISMGSWASWFVAIVTAICCLATNVVLTSIFTDYVHKDIFREKISRNMTLAGVGISSFMMSLLGFSGICSILGMILEKVYPALIVFVVVRIAHHYLSGARQRQSM
ncbi:MAG: branched-chain amino acid transport system II carrier protein [Holosporales bacterium]|jgi:LIVCS family branched-chain amino acid:cation transporter|nr:branched-chain amino acid transport system II carrier protein [Holosporales bacterium]